jgi:hypothetical protein
MLRIAHIEELTNLLLHVPSLIQMQEERSADFASSVSAWMKTLEDSLAAARLPQTALVAAARGTLLAAEYGQIPSGVAFQGRMTRSRIIGAAGLDALNKATSVASSVLMDNQVRLGEASRVAYQIAARAMSHGAISRRDPDASNSQYLSELRVALAEIDECKAALVHLEGLLGPYDALVALDRAIQPFISHATGEPLADNS